MSTWLHVNASSQTRDPERPARLLDEVLARREFLGETREAPDWLSRLLEQTFGAAGPLPDWLGAAITIAVLGGAAFFVLYLLFDGGSFRRRGGRRGTEAAPTAARVTVARDPAALFRAGCRAMRAGNDGEAIMNLFRAMIARLQDRGLLLPDTSRTNREHLRDLRERRAERIAVASALAPFESVRYGLHPAAPADTDRVFAAARTLFPEEPKT